MFETSPNPTAPSSPARQGLYQQRCYLRPAMPLSLWATCRHLLYLLDGTVYSLLFDAHERLVGCWGYTREPGTTQDIFLRFLFEKEPHLAQPYLEVEVRLAEVPFLVIPHRFTARPYHLALSRLMMEEDLLSEELHEQPLPGEDAYALFDAPPPLRHILDHYLGHYQLGHACGAWLRTLRRLADAQGNALLMTLLPHRVAIAALREGTLQICNAYPTHSPLEALYYLQSVREIIGWKGTPPAIFAQGEVTPDPNQVDTLWYHLPGLQTPPSRLLLSYELPASSEAWRFAFLST